MTTLAFSPQPPTSPQECRSIDASGPSGKAIVGWTLALFAVLGLAWFIGAVAWPVWQVRTALERLSSSRAKPSVPIIVRQGIEGKEEGEKGYAGV